MSMDNTQYIRDRTNQILNERIALGTTQGGARLKKCPPGQHPRRSYTTKKGTHVKATCIRNRGKAKIVRRKKTIGIVRKSTRKCPRGQHARRAYTTKLGTHVKASCIRNRRKVSGRRI